MREVKLILAEQFSYLGVAQRIAKYSNKALYQSHILGNLWQILSPLIQLGVYYFAFGIALGGARTVKGGVSYRLVDGRIKYMDFFKYSNKTSF